MPEDGFAAGSGEAERRVAGETVGRVAGEDCGRDGGENAADELVAELGEAGGPLDAVCGGEFEGFGEADCSGDVLRAGTPTAFLAAAVEDRLGLEAAAYIESADALGCA